MKLIIVCKCLVIACLLFLTADYVGALDEHYHVPSLGDGGTAFTTQEERRLGRLILLKARSNIPLFEDIELREYLNLIGERIVVASGSHQLDFNFLLSRSLTINASASPGGLIVINLGLLLAADNESELAAVIAHEIAHVKQRHIARLWSLAKQTRWLDVVSFVAALAGAAYHSDAALLGAYTGAALKVQKSLAYSQAFESEADYLGMNILVDAGFQPSAMASFFSKLQAKESGLGRVPEFLRTHPLTKKSYG